MTFLAPIMFAGAAAVSIPIALHFFYRARYKPLPWAPMKFLKEAVEQTSRRLKFQEWVLLALRCLALILLALALARPGRESATAGGGTQPIDAVFVFDTSFTMAAKDGDKTRLERAKAAALAIIDALPDKSSVQVISVADRATALGPVSRFNRDQAKQLVQALEVTSLSTDLLPGLNEALSAAETGRAESKEIYVFTDMQRAGFDRQMSALKPKCEEIKAKANLIFIRCGNVDRKTTNVAVTEVRLEAAIPHTKTRVPFVVKVKNTGRTPARAIKVFLDLDGKPVEEKGVEIAEIEPGDAATVTLTGDLTEAGARLLTARVTGDDIDGDNVMYKVVGVRDKVRVLLVAPPRRPEQSETDAGDWFARKALIPFDADKDRDKIANYFIETETVAPNEVGPDKLLKKDIVYLLNAAARTDNPLQGMAPAFVDKLAEFVKNGGGLIVGCGDAVNPAAYNRALGPNGAGLLPLPLGAVRTTTPAALFVPAATSIDENSVFGPMKPYTEWLARGELARMIDLDESPAAAAGATVLLRTTDNKPLVASRVVGQGEVIFFATSLDENWGRMMSDGQLAIPMTTHLVSHLTNRKVPGGTRVVGSPLSWAPPKAEAGYELIKPAKPSEKTRARVQLKDAKEVNGKLTVTSADTLVAGEYAIVPVGAADPVGLTGETGVVYVVNPDLRETENLETLTDGDAEKVLGFRPVILSAGTDTEAAVRERRTRGEWTEYALLFLLFLLVAEATWAWFCGKAK
ncbi:MAG: VWA domain-containing protein [Planctomycetes bacterium]|nr:VWA domain-containing protein [Planctomycetota bacterium]